MDIHLSLNGFVMFFGITLLAWIAGNAGSLLGIFISVFKPAASDRKLLTLAIMFVGMGQMQLIKIPFTLFVTAIMMYFYPDSALKAAMGFCAVAGCALMVFRGFSGTE